MSQLEVASLRNLGPKSASMLQNAGITSLDHIRKLGSVGTFLLVKEAEGRVSLNLLWALEGCLRDIDWRDLTDDVKAELLKELERD